MSGATQRWLHRKGELTRDGWETVVDGSLPGWKHTGVRVAELASGEALPISCDGFEAIVVPLSGTFFIEHGEGGSSSVTRLVGRESVFSGATDVLFLGLGSHAIVSGTGRVAVATAPTEETMPDVYLPVGNVPVELRGAGTSSREVHNFGVPGVIAASRLIVCEVITPAGNWSSYPPHKHDTYVPGHETHLEEIYYFEASPTDAAFGLFSVSSSPAGEIEIDARIQSGDVALVPFGYHGPAAAAPGYDLYYLNVMAGPDPERAWLITDDPAHAWVRQSWTEQTIDPRLPFGDHSRRQN